MAPSQQGKPSHAGMPLTPFLTAAGLIAAILLVWAQLWISAYTPGVIPLSAGLGLLWTYIAVIVALTAFAWAGWSWLKQGGSEKFQVTGWPLALLVAAVIMTAVDVCLSVASVAFKLFAGKSLSEQLIELTSCTAQVGSAIGVLLSAFIVIVFSRWLTRRFP